MTTDVGKPPTGRLAESIGWALPSSPSLFDLVVSPVAAAVLAGLFWLERFWPLRRRTRPARERLKTNAVLGVLAMLVMRGALVPSVVVMASWTDRNRIGLTRIISMPMAVAAVVAFVLMDYSTYLWHRLNHAAPVLWRFHGIHHTDLDLDVSTAFRFHFGEILLSVFTRALQITIIGVGPTVILVWEAAEVVATELHHSDVRLPLAVERALSRVMVTPRMHGIHHSIVERETNSNWGVVFSCWDRLHRTLRLDVPQEAITIGVPAYRDARELGLGRLLMMPLGRQRPTWSLPSGEHLDRHVVGDRWRMRG